MYKQGVFILLLVIVSTSTLFSLSSLHKVPAANSQTQAKSIHLVVKNNRLISGPTVIQAVEGDTISIHITADINGELHIHGYDKHVDFTKNKQAGITFTGNITGRFPYELENTKTEIGVLEV